MNIIRFQQEQVDGHTGLLACCRLPAIENGEEDLAAGLAPLPPQPPRYSSRDFLAEITEVGSRHGLRTRISRPATKQLFDPAVHLPLLAELHDRRTLLVETLDRDPAGEVTALTVQSPDPTETVLQERFARDDFLRLLTGTLLLFKLTNTALTSLALVAREHQIELTREHLIHQYALSTDEIPSATLVRMARDHGLKAKLLRLDWYGLFSLKKAWRAIAQLKNGRHMVPTFIGIALAVPFINAITQITPIFFQIDIENLAIRTNLLRYTIPALIG